MRRVSVGLFFVLHGLSHAAFGMAAQDIPGVAGYALSGPPRVWLATTLFFGAMPGFLAAGLGRFGVIGLARHWRTLARGATAASVALLLMFPRAPLTTALGLAFDGFAILLSMSLAGTPRDISTAGGGPQ